MSASLLVDGARVSRLPFGLTVVTQAMPHLATAALAVSVAAGSRHERQEEHGLAHFLEHMAFKGTARRSARAIADEIEAVGGDLNAATGIEHTSFTARVLREDVPLALDILSDILLHSTFPEAELKRERNVVLQEIGAVEDTPDDLIYDVFLEKAFSGQPLGRPILGTLKTVPTFDEAALRTYLDRQYLPEKMVVSAVGAVEHERIVAQVEELFAPLAVRAGRPAAAAEAPACYTGGEARVKRRLEQAHLVLGFNGVALGDPRHDAMQVFATALGGGVSSRLFQEVREERGLAYSIDAFHWAFADAGLFGIGAGCEGKDVAELADVALTCLQEAATGLTAGELSRAKAQMRMSLMAALESPAARADQLARQHLIFGRIVPRAEIEARVAAVTLEAARAAGGLLVASPPTVAGIGPIAALPRLATVAQRAKAA